MAGGVRLDRRLEARDEAGPYRRVELITGRRQRRRWTADEKMHIVAESAAPGASIAEVARRHGVNRGLLTVWRRQVGVVAADTGADGGAPRFIPVMSDKETPPPGAVSGGPAISAEPAAGRIEVDLRAGRLVFCGGVDPGLAVAILAAVRGWG